MSSNMQCTNSPTKRVYTVDEIAAILAISRGSAYKLVHAGLFPTVRYGSAIRVPMKSFDAWLENQTESED